MTEILLPQLGETVSEGTITRWFKQPGEAVAQDEPLYEVSTDKVDTEVPAPMAGVVSEILVAEGETVEVGTLLAQLEADGAAVAGGDAAGSKDDRADGGTDGEAKPEAKQKADLSAGTEKPEAEQTATAEDLPAAEMEKAASEEPATQQPVIQEASLQQPAVQQQAVPEPPESASPSDPSAEKSVAAAHSEVPAQRISPVVRRLLHKHGIEPASIAGTGPKGRITRKDAEEAVKKAGSASKAAGAAKKTATVSATGRMSPTTIAPGTGDGVSQASAKASSPHSSQPSPSSSTASPSSAHTEAIPLSRIRKATAEHMVRSKATSPHVLTAVEVDFEEVEKARRAHRDEWKAEEGFSLTYLPFIARAVCDALDDYPHINATVAEEELIVHHSVNLAVAVDLDFQGLIAPVVHGAENLRLRAIARQVVDLAKRARSKQLRPEEVAGGTFTITNPGQWGTMMQFPIINQPQVAILSTDGIKRKPVVVTDRYGGESIAIHSVGVLALAWDHRAFDGAYVAAFLDELRRIIETRDWEAELA